MDSRKASTRLPVRQRYWPGHWLIPVLDVLSGQLLPDLEDFEKYRRVELQIEQLPYCLGATCYALFELVTTQNVTVTHDIVTGPEEHGIHILRSYERDRMGFLLDSVLEASRRTQNALIPYINRARHINLPASMHATVKRLEEKPGLLPNSLSDLLTSYWHKHGMKLKLYRDLSQHHALVSSDARTFISSEGLPSIYLTLPNNPEAKSLADLKYEAPFVHAVPYLHSEFYQLVRICNLVCEQLLDRSKPLKAIMGQPIKGILTTAGQQGHRIININDIMAPIRRMIPQIQDPVGLW